MILCNLGFTLDGSPHGGSDFVRQCTKDGTFSVVPDKPCKPIFGGKAPSLANAGIIEYAGRPANEFNGDLYYPNAIEYRCDPGFTETGSLSGATKIVSRVSTTGALAPPLPNGCLPITFTVHGRVQNSLNGQSLQGVTVSVSGTGIKEQTSGGIFELKGVRPGTITLVYERDGYIKATKELQVTSDVRLGGIADIAMSPKMTNDQWRAVVKWDREPTDLDTYAKWGWSKVCWYGTFAQSAGLTGILEHDDVNSWGPETLFLRGVGSCNWGPAYCDIKYIINDYTESGRMKDISKATVTLYTGERVAGSWKIEDCQGSVSQDGNWWHVFTLDGKDNKLKWSCSQSETVNFNLLNPSQAQNQTLDAGNYVGTGPFPGRFFRHSQTPKSWDLRHPKGVSLPPKSWKLQKPAADLLSSNSTSHESQSSEAKRLSPAVVTHPLLSSRRLLESHLS